MQKGFNKSIYRVFRDSNDAIRKSWICIHSILKYDKNQDSYFFQTVYQHNHRYEYNHHKVRDFSWMRASTIKNSNKFLFFSVHTSISLSAVATTPTVGRIHNTKLWSLFYSTLHLAPPFMSFSNTKHLIRTEKKILFSLCVFCLNALIPPFKAVSYRHIIIKILSSVS